MTTDNANLAALKRILASPPETQSGPDRDALERILGSSPTTPDVYPPGERFGFAKSVLRGDPDWGALYKKPLRFVESFSALGAADVINLMRAADTASDYVPGAELLKGMATGAMESAKPYLPFVSQALPPPLSQIASLTPHLDMSPEAQQRRYDMAERIRRRINEGIPPERWGISRSPSTLVEGWEQMLGDDQEAREIRSFLQHEFGQQPMSEQLLFGLIDPTLAFGGLGKAGALGAGKMLETGAMRGLAATRAVMPEMVTKGVSDVARYLPKNWDEAGEAMRALQDTVGEWRIMNRKRSIEAITSPPDVLALPPGRQSTRYEDALVFSRQEKLGKIPEPPSGTAIPLPPAADAPITPVARTAREAIEVPDGLSDFSRADFDRFNALTPDEQTSRLQILNDAEADRGGRFLGEETNLTLKESVEAAARGEDPRKLRRIVIDERGSEVPEGDLLLKEGIWDKTDELTRKYIDPDEPELGFLDRTNIIPGPNARTATGEVAQSLKEIDIVASRTAADVPGAPTAARGVGLTPDEATELGRLKRRLALDEEFLDKASVEQRSRPTPHLLPGSIGYRPPLARTAARRVEEIRDAENAVTVAKEEVSNAQQGVKDGLLEPADLTDARSALTDARADLKQAKRPAGHTAKEKAYIAEADKVEKEGFANIKTAIARAKDEIAALEAKAAGGVPEVAARGAEAARTGSIVNERQALQEIRAKYQPLIADAFNAGDNDAYSALDAASEAEELAASPTLAKRQALDKERTELLPLVPEPAFMKSGGYKPALENDPTSKRIAAIDSELRDLKPDVDYIIGSTDTPPATAAAISEILPGNLATAKPGYSIGKVKYTPQFDNDIDKALFIVSPKKTGKKAKRDENYMDWLRDIFPGMDDAAIRNAGAEVRDHIKTSVSNKPAGNVNIPTSRTVGDLLSARPTAKARLDIPDSGFDPSYSVGMDPEIKRHVPDNRATNMTAKEAEVTLATFKALLFNPRGLKESQQWEHTLSQAKAKRVARANEVYESSLDQGMDENTAVRIAKRELEGPYSYQVTDMAREMTDEVIDALYHYVHRHPALKNNFFELLSTLKALTNAVAGRPITRKPGTKGGSAYSRLAKVFGEDMVDALNTPNRLQVDIEKNLKDMAKLPVTAMTGRTSLVPKYRLPPPESKWTPEDMLLPGTTFGDVPKQRFLPGLDPSSLREQMSQVWIPSKIGSQGERIGGGPSLFPELTPKVRQTGFPTVNDQIKVDDERIMSDLMRGLENIMPGEGTPLRGIITQEAPVKPGMVRGTSAIDEAGMIVKRLHDYVSYIERQLPKTTLSPAMKENMEQGMVFYRMAAKRLEEAIQKEPIPSALTGTETKAEVIQFSLDMPRWDAKTQQAVEKVVELDPEVARQMIRVLGELGYSPMDIGNLIRANMSSADLSFARQANMLIWGNPINFRRAWVKGFRALWSEEYAKKLDEARKADKEEMATYDRVVRQGGADFLRPLDQKQIKRYKDLWQANEDFMILAGGPKPRLLQTFAGKMPHITFSARAHATALNELTWSIFIDHHTKALDIQKEIAKGVGKVPIFHRLPGWLQRTLPLGSSKYDEAFSVDSYMKDIANMLGDMSGRGPVPGFLKELTPAMNVAFFSMRHQSSRLATPRSLFSSVPEVRRSAWKNVVSWATAWTSIILLGREMGLWDVETDSRSVDFGKLILFGRLRVDVLGGYQAYMVLFTRLLMSLAQQPAIKSSTTGELYELEGQRGVVRVMSDFILGRGAPVISNVLVAWTAEDYVGRDVDRKDIMGWVSRNAPMVSQDIYDAFDAGGLLGLPWGALAGLGGSVYATELPRWRETDVYYSLTTDDRAVRKQWRVENPLQEARLFVRGHITTLSDRTSSYYNRGPAGNEVIRLMKEYDLMPEDVPGYQKTLGIGSPWQEPEQPREYRWWEKRQPHRGRMSKSVLDMKNRVTADLDYFFGAVKGMLGDGSQIDFDMLNEIAPVTPGDGSQINFDMLNEIAKR